MTRSGRGSTDFHPDLRRLARALPQQPINRRTYRLVRALGKLAEMRPAKDVEIVQLAAEAAVRVHRPTQPGGDAAVLWIHGGGYVIGSAAADDGLCRRFVAELGVTVASVDYRLAPEHPYPAPLEDCYAALAWLAGQPGVERIVIGGASAGGGLAAALALMARDRGEIAPVFQLLVYPMLDDRSSTTPGLHDARHRMWGQRSNAFGWDSYLGDADPETVTPSRRADLTGLPPAWIGVGSLDLFHDEDLAYARRLTEAGVPCTVDVVDGAFHGFDIITPRAAVSRTFFARQCEVLRLALGLD
ncbi:MAG: lip2 1 [Aeromicrobium sp.]|nr:lip2 1 [Aeromicrobium sp.]